MLQFSVGRNHFIQSSPFISEWLVQVASSLSLQVSSLNFKQKINYRFLQLTKKKDYSYHHTITTYKHSNNVVLRGNNVSYFKMIVGLVFF